MICHERKHKFSLYDMIYLGTSSSFILVMACQPPDVIEFATLEYTNTEYMSSTMYTCLEHYTFETMQTTSTIQCIYNSEEDDVEWEQFNGNCTCKLYR